MAGLLQYYFFPTDFFYPREEKRILPIETRKRDGDDDEDGIAKHKSKLSKSSVPTELLLRSRSVIKAGLPSKSLNSNIVVHTLNPLNKNYGN
ncbi:hypothetical protein ACOSQ3_027097 [Xanthoceras sorbifolium]